VAAGLGRLVGRVLFPDVIDDHVQIWVAARIEAIVEADIAHVHRTEALDRLRNTPEERRHVILTWPLRIGLRKVRNGPCGKLCHS